MINTEWDNEPETLRHLWLKQCDACYQLFVNTEKVQMEYPNNIVAMDCTQVTRRVVLAERSTRKELMRGKWKHCKNGLLLVCKAKKNYETAGGDYKSD
jgi:hypothetical protein